MWQAPHRQKLPCTVVLCTLSAETLCGICSGFAQLSNLTNLEHLYVGAGMPVTDATLTNTLAPLQRLRCVGKLPHVRYNYGTPGIGIVSVTKQLGWVAWRS
jgi:hypothetical protein